MKHLRLFDAPDGADVIQLGRHFGVPSLGLQPSQIGCDDGLLREIVLRSQLEYAAAECWGNDKPMKPDDMARRFGLLLTCDAGKPPVPLSSLIHEARRRAESGSAVAADFIHEFDSARRVHPLAEAAVEVVVHGLIVGQPGLPRSEFVRRFLGNHRVGGDATLIIGVD
jgi:hypothetical protein